MDFEISNEDLHFVLSPFQLAALYFLRKEDGASILIASKCHSLAFLRCVGGWGSTITCIWLRNVCQSKTFYLLFKT